jgi:hypothetical protein
MSLTLRLRRSRLMKKQLALQQRQSEKFLILSGEKLELF